jgi:hypothetical protein
VTVLFLRKRSDTTSSSPVFVWFSTSFEQAAAARALLVFLVEAGEPSRETLHRSFKLRMEVDEGAQLISQPSESDLIVPPTCLELLDAPIGEVHIYSYARFAHGAGKVLSSSVFAQCDRRELGVAKYPRRRAPSSFDHQAPPPTLAERDPSCTYPKAASIRARCCCR